MSILYRSRVDALKADNEQLRVALVNLADRSHYSPAGVWIEWKDDPWEVAQYGLDMAHFYDALLLGQGEQKA